MNQGGLRPHVFCLPILKHEKHRQAILEAAISGDSRFFLGTDSAPHAQGDKVNFSASLCNWVGASSQIQFTSILFYSARSINGVFREKTIPDRGI